MQPIVSVEGGSLRGLAPRDGEPFRFWGVPFAAPPVNELRWRPACPMSAWEGERPAVRFAPAPFQGAPMRNSLLYAMNLVEPHPIVMSEDCLYLNIWTPELGSARMPVFVWVPGGQNRFGSGSQSLYDGGHLANLGMVVVTLNYRLGMIGWLAHPELRAESKWDAAGNYGLSDIVAALRWVQLNIDRFGGDPSRVTLAGNSAGASHVSHLMASPVAAGLFHRAIGQSGGAGFRGMTDLEEAQSVGEAFVASKGVGSIDELRLMSAPEVLLGAEHGAVIDGWMLPRSTKSVFEDGAQHAVPLLVGTNADEASIYEVYQTSRSLADKASQYGALSKAFLDIYPASSEAEARRSARRALTNERFGWPVWRWATTHRRSCGSPVWLYRFTAAPPIPRDGIIREPADCAGPYGSFHTAELPYVFHSLHRRSWPWTPEDYDLAEAMAGAWYRFAATGSPGEAAVWPAIEGDSGPAMFFGRRCESGSIPDLRAMLLHDEAEGRVR